MALVFALLACREGRTRGCPRCPDPAAVTTSISGRADEGVASLPSGDAVGDAMAGATERVRRCGPFVGVRRAVVSVTFSGAGAAVEARAFPPLAGTAQGACVQDAVRGVTLPLAASAPLSLTWSYDVAPLAPSAPYAPAPTRAQSPLGAVRCGHLDPETGLIRVCFDNEPRR